MPLRVVLASCVCVVQIRRVVLHSKACFWSAVVCVAKRGEFSKSQHSA